jgi:hypothetical protein
MNFMTTKQSIGLIFSQNDDFTKLAIVLPTQTAKNILYWIILPAISSSLVCFSGVLPTAEGHPQLHPSSSPVTEAAKPRP